MLSLWIVLVAALTIHNASVQAVFCQPGLNFMSLKGAVITSNLASLPGHGPMEANNLTGPGWCTAELISVEDPYIQFNFTDVYAVYNAEVRGVNTTNVTSYVTSLQVSADPVGSGEYYLIVDPETNIPRTQNTSLNDASEVGHVLFNETLGFAARSLRILPQTWSGNPPCMRIELIGCLADINTVHIPQETTPTDDNRVLIIGILIALVILLIVVMIAIVSVSLCWHFSHKNGRLKEMGRHTSELEDDRTIKHVKNAMYAASSNRRFDQSSNTYMVSQSPQPYEVARPSITDQTLSNTYPGSSSMGSYGYAKVRDGHGQEVKEYETVNFDPMKQNTERNEGYEVIGEASTENGATKPIRAYATVTMEESEATEKKAPSPVVYSTLESPKDTSYLNVAPKSPIQQEQEFGITESYGPEHFEV